MLSSLVTRVIAIVLLFFAFYFIATGFGLSDRTSTLTAGALALVLVLFWGPISKAWDITDTIKEWLSWIR